MDIKELGELYLADVRKKGITARLCSLATIVVLNFTKLSTIRPDLVFWWSIVLGVFSILGATLTYFMIERRIKNGTYGDCECEARRLIEFVYSLQ